jgi:glycosyltransferase involved in cell wall biosynthesis
MVKEDVGIHAGASPATLALVSTALAPSASGQARVLESLLRGMPADRCIQMSDRMEFLEKVPADQRIGRYVPLSPARSGRNATVFRRAREIAGILRAVPRPVIVGCTADPFDLPASFLAARWRRAPFVAYLFDDPVFQWPAGSYRRFARGWERIWAKFVDAVVTPNELLAGDVSQREPRVKPVIIRNPVKLDAFTAPERPWPANAAGPLRILYTGSVYHAQGDAFRNLVAAMDRFPGRYELHVYTSQPQSEFEKYGIAGPNVVRHEYVDGDAIHPIQQSADILFLPLAFFSTIQEVIRTSAPLKMGEYLATGRPVLVHAPAGSFVSTFYRSHACGLVVDQPDVDALAKALSELSHNAKLRAEIVAAARRTVPEFGLDRSRKTFWSLIEQMATA